MTQRHMPPVVAALTALFLAGCNSVRAPVAVAPPDAAAMSRAPSGFQLPEGAGCSGAIGRYRAILDNDLAMGHVNRGVYDRIQSEIEEAASACSAGRDARAGSLIHASKARHGYPG